MSNKQKKKQRINNKDQVTRHKRVDRTELGYGSKVAIMSIAAILGILTVIIIVLLIYFRGILF